MQVFCARTRSRLVSRVVRVWCVRLVARVAPMRRRLLSACRVANQGKSAASRVATMVDVAWFPSPRRRKVKTSVSQPAITATNVDPLLQQHAAPGVAPVVEGSSRVVVSHRVVRQRSRRTATKRAFERRAVTKASRAAAINARVRSPARGLRAGVRSRASVSDARDSSGIHALRHDRQIDGPCQRRRSRLFDHHRASQISRFILEAERSPRERPGPDRSGKAHR